MKIIGYYFKRYYEQLSIMKNKCVNLRMQKSIQLENFVVNRLQAKEDT